jgi:putative DNA primase/helicase
MYEICKKALPQLLSGEQEGNLRYLFVVDHPEVAQAIYAYGCSAVLITTDEELKEIVAVYDAVNMVLNNITTVLCCRKSVNNAIAEAAENKRIIPSGAYMLYGSKKLYYTAHPDELAERLDELIAGLEGKNGGEGGLVRDKVSGMILTSSKDNSYRRVAEYFIDKYDIVCIENEIYINKVGRIYELFTPDINDRLLINELHNSTSRHRKELYTYIVNYAPKRQRTEGFIAFTNCVYSIAEETVMDFTDDMYFTSWVPHRFTTDEPDRCYSDRIDKFYNEIACGDEELKALLLDITAYCLTEGNHWQKTFIFYGDGCNGKGVLFRVLESIMGVKNVAYRSWSELTTTTGRFGIVGKQLILCNDIDDIYIKQVQALKTLTACEPQTIKQLYRDEFTATFRGKIITACNSVPRVNDTTNGWGRRVIIVPFNGNFINSQDVHLADKLTDERCIEYLIALCVLRLNRVLENGFTHSDKVDNLLKEYRMENNPILQFVEEYSDNFKGEDNAKALDTIYGTWYMNFCRANSYKPYSKLGFAKRIKSAGMKWKYIYGTNKRIYYVSK